jgi:hypothetical protein
MRHSIITVYENNLLRACRADSPEVNLMQKESWLADLLGNAVFASVVGSLVHLCLNKPKNWVYSSTSIFVAGAVTFYATPPLMLLLPKNIDDSVVGFLIGTLGKEIIDKIIEKSTAKYLADRGIVITQDSTTTSATQTTTVTNQTATQTSASPAKAEPAPTPEATTNDTI